MISLGSCKSVAPLSGVPHEAEDPLPDKQKALAAGDRKANIAPPADKSKWLKLMDVALDNGRPFDTRETGRPS